MKVLARSGNFLRQRQRWVLVALLAVLHLTLLAGVASTIGRMFWLVDVGLFILWQPFIQAERRLDAASVLLLTVLLGWGFGCSATGCWFCGCCSCRRCWVGG